MVSEPSLAARQVSFAYDGSPVVRDVSLTLRRGELVALVGPNGSGKTTLLKLLSGARRPLSGEVMLDERPLRRFRARQRAQRIALVPQYTDPNLLFRVRDLVQMGRTPYQSPLAVFASPGAEPVEHALQATGADALAGRRFADLSGGEQQRVVLAMALAQESDFLLLDEPTVHLDLLHQYELLELLRRLHAERNLGVLAVMHDLNLAALYFHRLVVLEAGRLVGEGAPGDILRQPDVLNVFRAPLHVINHPQTGAPQILLQPRL